MDQAIDILTPESDIHERCVRALRKACGIYGLLPDSHEVKFTLAAGEHALASGGFSDVWKATNDEGEMFAVKVLRMYQNNAAQVKKVWTWCLAPPFLSLGERFLITAFRNIVGRLLYPGG